MQVLYGNEGVSYPCINVASIGSAVDTTYHPRDEGPLPSSIVGDPLDCLTVGIGYTRDNLLARSAHYQSREMEEIPVRLAKKSNRAEWEIERDIVKYSAESFICRWNGGCMGCTNIITRHLSLPQHTFSNQGRYNSLPGMQL